MPDDASDLPKWQQLAAAKRRVQAETIAPFTRLQGPAHAEEILAVDDVGELAEMIAKGQWKAFDVALAYVQSAAKAREKACMHRPNLRFDGNLSAALLRIVSQGLDGLCGLFGE